MLYSLIPRPDSSHRTALVVKARVSRRRDGRFVLINFAVHGGIKNVRWPDAAKEGRADELWKHSCFEAFVAPNDSASYVELNFAPGRQWAAYAFDAPRAGMRNEPDLMVHRMDWYVRDLSLPRVEMHVLLEMPNAFENVTWHLNLSAVIEENDGTKSYWALAHPPGPPDFHDRDCFIATLPAPAGA